MSAGYGTVLGAARHHGFIPWDDDMDLLMPREDYLVNNYGNWNCIPPVAKRWQHFIEKIDLKIEI